MVRAWLWESLKGLQLIRERKSFVSGGDGHVKLAWQREREAVMKRAGRNFKTLHRVPRLLEATSVSAVENKGLSGDLRHLVATAASHYSGPYIKGSYYSTILLRVVLYNIWHDPVY